MRSTLVVAAGLLLVVFAVAPCVRADEEKVPLKDVPKVVLDAVKAKFPGAELTGAEKETEKGKTQYEVALKHEGREIEATVTAAGRIVEIETEIDLKDLPKAVTAAVAAKHPKATLKEAETIVSIDEAGKETKNYEVEVTEGKKTIELVVSPEGKILKEEVEDEDKD